MPELSSTFLCLALAAQSDRFTAKGPLENNQPQRFDLNWR